jgi:hypothetical protein
MFFSLSRISLVPPKSEKENNTRAAFLVIPWSANYIYTSQNIDNKELSPRVNERSIIAPHCPRKHDRRLGLWMTRLDVTSLRNFASHTPSQHQ